MFQIGAPVDQIRDHEERGLGRDSAQGVREGQLGMASGGGPHRRHAARKRRDHAEEHRAGQRFADAADIRETVGQVCQAHADKQHGQSGRGKDGDNDNEG